MQSNAAKIRSSQFLLVLFVKTF